jgi:hypothetical protein
MPHTFRAVLGSMKTKDGETTIVFHVPKSDYDRVNPCGALDNQVLIVTVYSHDEAAVLDHDA